MFISTVTRRMSSAWNSQMSYPVSQVMQNEFQSEYQNEVHIVPFGTNAWAVNIGKMSYQAFESEEKALLFGKKMASQASQSARILFHHRDGSVEQVGDEGKFQH